MSLMKKQPTLLAFACALVLAQAAAPAFADATASATFGNVRITLTDLDLNDGITPSISINFGSQPYLNGAIGSYGPEFVRDGYAHLGKNAGSQVTDSVQAEYASSSAAMSGANNVSGVSWMTVAGTALSGPAGFGEFGALAANYTSTSFMLTANTALTISVDVTMNVATTLGWNPDPGANQAEHASSHVHMLFDGYDANGASLLDEQYQELYVDGQVDANGHITGAQQSWSGTVSVSFNNLSSQAQLGNFYSEIGVGGASMLAAVPEPESYALLLAGLGVVGGVVRRRRAG